MFLRLGNENATIYGAFSGSGRSGAAADVQTGKRT
jgi:hypothetical protein